MSFNIYTVCTSNACIVLRQIIAQQARGKPEIVRVTRLGALSPFPIPKIILVKLQVCCSHVGSAVLKGLVSSAKRGYVLLLRLLL